MYFYLVQNISINNQNFKLHPSGAIFWSEKQLLLIADVHLGKVAHFRKHGSAVPQQVITKNFEQLDRVLSEFDATEICFLGDLFHSHINTEWILFEQWVRSKKVSLSLVTGNHDIINPLRFKELDFELYSERMIDTFLLTHEPEDRAGYFNFCGHIHPGVILQGSGKQHLRLPCFFKQPLQLILPAFGSFTGLYILEPSKEDAVFVIGDGEVIAISR